MNRSRFSPFVWATIIEADLEPGRPHPGRPQGGNLHRQCAASYLKPGRPQGSPLPYPSLPDSFSSEGGESGSPVRATTRVPTPPNILPRPYNDDEAAPTGRV